MTAKRPSLRTSGASSDRSADIARRAAASDDFVKEAADRQAAPALFPVTTRINGELGETLRRLAFERRQSVAQVAREILEDGLKRL